MWQSIIRFAKKWTLPLAIIFGIAGYCFLAALELSIEVKADLLEFISWIQPLLIFTMLFLSFCKVNPQEMVLRRWHLWLLLIQTGVFLAMAFLSSVLSTASSMLLAECIMLCFICPTATAAAVVTGKLGGDMAGIVTYTMLGNLVATLVLPAVLPLLHSQKEFVAFLPSCWLITKHVFPMLICPFLLAVFVRYALPALHRQMVATKDLAFYLWCICLTLSIAVAMKSLMHSHINLALLSGVALVSLLSCGLQFFVGRCIGRAYNSLVTVGQAMGQKNTAFAIWLGFTFMSPVSSVAGGFYAIWHNLFNAWQLARQDKTQPS